MNGADWVVRPPWRLAKAVIHPDGKSWYITWHGVMGSCESRHPYATRIQAYTTAMECGAKKIEVLDG